MKRWHVRFDDHKKCLTLTDPFNVFLKHEVDFDQLMNLPGEVQQELLEKWRTTQTAEAFISLSPENLQKLLS